jgi:hypothetical protein
MGVRLYALRRMGWSAADVAEAAAAGQPPRRRMHWRWGGT